MFHINQRECLREIDTEIMVAGEWNSISEMQVKNIAGLRQNVKLTGHFFLVIFLKGTHANETQQDFEFKILFQ